VIRVRVLRILVFPSFFLGSIRRFESVLIRSF
jgi:hypothetical protein